MNMLVDTYATQKVHQAKPKKLIHAFPKVDLLSVVRLINFFIRVETSISSRRSLWAFIMAKCVSLSCDMVLRSQVFNLRKAEKERSDAATDMGRHRHSLMSFSTSDSMERVCGCVVWRMDTTSRIVLTSRMMICLNCFYVIFPFLFRIFTNVLAMA